MANSFNVVTALQTIHEHTHAVGFGCIPSDWTTGDPAAFCEVNNLFVPGLAAWFFDVVRRPFGDGSCELGISLPRDCTWDVRNRKIGSGWRRNFSCGSHSPLSVMEIMEMGGGKREVRFIFRRNPEALLGALWCLNMMGRVGVMPFDPQVYLLHTMKHGDGLLLDATVCVSDTFYFVDDRDTGYGILWHGRDGGDPVSRTGVTEMKASAIRAHPDYEDVSLPLSVRCPGAVPAEPHRSGTVIAEMTFTVPLHAARRQREADLWALL